MKLPIATTALLAAIALSACGSSSSKSSSAPPAGTTPAPASTNPTSTSPTSTTQAKAPTGASGAAGGKVEIKMVNIAFSPTSTKAKVGQTVVWTNQDSTDHNVVATAGDSFKSSNFGSGQTYSHRVTKAGTISYVCTLHPNMKATLTVTR